jgi:hypothetical protein
MDLGQNFRSAITTVAAQAPNGVGAATVVIGLIQKRKWINGLLDYCGRNTLPLPSSVIPRDRIPVINTPETHENPYPEKKS